MKKWICAVLIFSMVLALAACGTDTPPETKPLQLGPPETSLQEDTPTQPEVPAPTQPGDQDYEGKQKPMIALSLPIYSVQEYNADVELIFQSRVQGTPVDGHPDQHINLILQDRDVAEAVIQDLNHRIDAGRKAAQETLESAQEYYMGAYFLYDLLFTPTRLDEQILSLSGLEIQYAGGARPNTVTLSVTYDLVTGRVLTLRELLTEESGAADALKRAVLGQFDTYDGYLFDDYEKTVSRFFENELGSESGWNLTDTGLRFTYSAGELSSYAAGPISVEVPYGELLGILSGHFFPTERSDQSGKLHAVLFEDLDREGFTQYAEVVLDPGLQKIAFYSEGILYDVQVTKLVATESGYAPSSVVLACTTLSAGDAIIVETDMPDTYPALLITYTAGGKEYSYTVFQSGEDGHLILEEA